MRTKAETRRDRLWHHPMYVALILLGVAGIAAGAWAASDRFSDVTDDHPVEAIEWAADQGITKGCGDGTRFCPYQPLTRKHARVFVERFYDQVLGAGEDDQFAGEFTRAQMVTVLYLMGVEKAMTDRYVLPRGSDYIDASCSEGVCVFAAWQPNATSVVVGFYPDGGREGREIWLEQCPVVEPVGDLADETHGPPDVGVVLDGGRESERWGGWKEPQAHTVQRSGQITEAEAGWGRVVSKDWRDGKVEIVPDFFYTVSAYGVPGRHYTFELALMCPIATTVDDLLRPYVERLDHAMVEDEPTTTTTAVPTTTTTTAVSTTTTTTVLRPLPSSCYHAQAQHMSRPDLERSWEAAGSPALYDSNGDGVPCSVGDNFDPPPTTTTTTQPLGKWLLTRGETVWLTHQRGTSWGTIRVCVDMTERTEGPIYGTIGRLPTCSWADLNLYLPEEDLPIASWEARPYGNYGWWEMVGRFDYVPGSLVRVDTSGTETSNFPTSSSIKQRWDLKEGFISAPRPEPVLEGDYRLCGIPHTLLGVEYWFHATGGFPVPADGPLECEDHQKARKWYRGVPTLSVTRPDGSLLEILNCSQQDSNTGGNYMAEYICDYGQLTQGFLSMNRIIPLPDETLRLLRENGYIR